VPTLELQDFDDIFLTLKNILDRKNCLAKRKSAPMIRLTETQIKAICHGWLSTRWLSTNWLSTTGLTTAISVWHYAN